MVSRVPMAAIADDAGVVARAEETVAAAADHLKVPAPELTPTAMGHQLDNLRQRLEQRIALPSDPSDDWATTAEILISILRVQCELLDNDLARRVKSISEIRHALGYLRGLPALADFSLGRSHGAPSCAATLWTFLRQWFHCYLLNQGINWHAIRRSCRNPLNAYGFPQSAAP